MLKSHILKPGYNARAQKYKSLLHCTESLEGNDTARFADRR